MAAGRRGTDDSHLAESSGAGCGRGPEECPLIRSESGAHGSAVSISRSSSADGAEIEESSGCGDSELLDVGTIFHWRDNSASSRSWIECRSQWRSGYSDESGHAGVLPHY